MQRFIILFFFLLMSCSITAQEKWSEKMAATAMRMWPDSFAAVPGNRARWSYDQGVILKGIEGVWRNTGNGAYFKYIQHSMDYYVKEDGTIYDYKTNEFNIDHINNGKLLLLLYNVTGKEKYKKAIALLRGQLLHHPRTSEGGFWHKEIYPYQMWLDGLYMGQPFYAEYAKLFRVDSIFDDVTRQFVLMEKHARDPKTGLLYHGWDESKQQLWANKTTGLSPHVWARAMGWYGMALVDALDHFPAQHEGRFKLIEILNRFAKAIVNYQDAGTGVWYDIVDMPKAPGNYIEASASCMLVYTLAKGISNHYLPEQYLKAANKGYDGIRKAFLQTDANGQLNLNGTVSVSGLGGKPYRDGSFEYYMSEKIRINDPKGIGAFIKCAVEMERLQMPKPGKGKTVLLDRYYNSEKKADFTGTSDYWHYIWEAQNDAGFYGLGQLFKNNGASLAVADIAPTAALLKQAHVYIIVDPDHPKDNPSPNYIQLKEVGIIKDWVQKGGTLVLMANDSANCDLQHVNQLAAAFGIRFTPKSINMVKNEQLEVGAVNGNDAMVFKIPSKMYLKEISTLETFDAAKPLVMKEGNIIMATTYFGKGKVFAVGDPWIYNEYLDGRRLPPTFENFKAANQWIQWLLGSKK